MARDKLVAECKRRFDEDDDFEKLISFLRDLGCTKIDSVAILVRATGIDLGRAKELVHFSPTWEGTRLADEEFQKAAADAIEKLK